MTRALIIVAVVLALSSGGATQGGNTYDQVVSGTKCFKNGVGDLECDYRVGQSLHFGVAGVGKPDASIYFYSASFEGDFFAVFGLSHGCVIVRPGRGASEVRQLDLAFVSPRNGQVYRTFELCGKAK